MEHGQTLTTVLCIVYNQNDPSQSYRFVRFLGEPWQFFAVCGVLQVEGLTQERAMQTEIEIKWPSGQVTTSNRVGADRMIEVTEGAEWWRRTSRQWRVLLRHSSRGFHSHKENGSRTVIPK